MYRDILGHRERQPLDQGQHRQARKQKSEGARTKHDVFRFAVKSGLACGALWTATGKANLFDAILVIADTGGPIKTIPASCSATANFAFSLKKPYLRGGSASEKGLEVGRIPRVDRLTIECIRACLTDAL